VERGKTFAAVLAHGAVAEVYHWRFEQDALSNPKLLDILADGTTYTRDLERASENPGKLLSIPCEVPLGGANSPLALRCSGQIQCVVHSH
jgi:hypothetical protein